MPGKFFLRRPIRYIRSRIQTAKQEGLVAAIARVSFNLLAVGLFLSFLLGANRWLSGSFLLAFFLGGFLVVGIELVGWSKELLKWKAGAILGGLLFSVISFLSYILASHRVHALVQEPAQSFPFSVKLFSVGFLLMLLATAASWFGVSMAVVVMLLDWIDERLVRLFHSRVGRFAQFVARSVTGRRISAPPASSSPLILARIAGFVAVGFLPLFLLYGYRNGVQYLGVDPDQIGAWTIALVDFFPGSHCEGLPDGARVAYLGGDRISVAITSIDDGVEFVSSTCLSEPMVAELD